MFFDRQSDVLVPISFQSSNENVVECLYFNGENVCTAKCKFYVLAIAVNNNIDRAFLEINGINILNDNISLKIADASLEEIIAEKEFPTRAVITLISLDATRYREQHKILIERYENNMLSVDNVTDMTLVYCAMLYKCVPIFKNVGVGNNISIPIILIHVSANNISLIQFKFDLNSYEILSDDFSSLQFDKFDDLQNVCKSLEAAIVVSLLPANGISFKQSIPVLNLSQYLGTDYLEIVQKTFVECNIHDNVIRALNAETDLIIVKNHRLLELAVKESQLTGINIDSLATTHPSIRARRMVVLKAIENNYLLRSRKHILNSQIHLRGGIQLNAEIGLHDNVIEIDVRSMYPSIMIESNIGLCSTFLCKRCDGVYSKHIFSEKDFNLYHCFSHYIVASMRNVDDVFTIILKHLQHERLRALNELENSNENIYLCKRQLQMKLYSNILYGLLADSKHDLLFNPIAASTITYIGRCFLQKLVSGLTALNCKVLAGHTDSVFLKNENISKSNISTFETKHVKLCQKNIFSRMVIISSQMYVGLLDNNKVIIKGIEKNICTSFYQFLSHCMRTIILTPCVAKNLITKHFLEVATRFECFRTFTKTKPYVCVCSSTCLNESQVYEYNESRFKRRRMLICPRYVFSHGLRRKLFEQVSQHCECSDLANIDEFVDEIKKEMIEKCNFNEQISGISYISMKHILPCLNFRINVESKILSRYFDNILHRTSEHSLNISLVSDKQNNVYFSPPISEGNCYEIQRFHNDLDIFVFVLLLNSDEKYYKEILSLKNQHNKIKVFSVFGIFEFDKRKCIKCCNYMYY